MRINVDVKCFKTSEDGRILTAQLTGNSVLVIEPEKRVPTKREKWVVWSRTNKQAMSLILDSEKEADEVRDKLNKANLQYQCLVASIIWYD